MTAIRVTGLRRDGQEVTAPQSFPAAPRVTVALPVEARALRVDYLSGTTVVATGLHNVRLEPQKTETLTRPFFEREPALPAPDDREGEFGGTAETLASPAPINTTSNLTAFLGEGRPLALLPQHVSWSKLFGGNVTLPPRVVIESFPPIGQQGKGGNLTGYPGTCIAWSYGYGVGSYVAAQNPDFTLPANFTFSNSTTGSNLASPMYLYEVAIQALGVNATGKFATNGTFIPCTTSTDIYLPFMVGYGAATMSQLEYAPSAAALLSGANTVATIPPSASLQLGSYARVLAPQQSGLSTPPSTIDQLKQYLANGQPMAFATAVWNNFLALPTTNGVYYGSGCSKGGHGMVIVGYDDTVGAPGQQGAFLVQNSFGTAWPDPGYYPSPSPCPSAVPSPDASPLPLASPGQFYLAYSAFASTTNGIAVAYPVEPSPPSGGFLTGTPSAAINSTYQVTEGNTTILVLTHWFAQPMLLQSLTLTDPQGNVATNPLRFPMRNGYTHVRRTDGQSFLSGTYGVTLAASTGTTNVTYTGNVTVGKVGSGFRPLPAAAFPQTLIGREEAVQPGHGRTRQAGVAEQDYVTLAQGSQAGEDSHKGVQGGNPGFAASDPFCKALRGVALQARKERAQGVVARGLERGSERGPRLPAGRRQLACERIQTGVLPDRLLQRRTPAPHGPERGGQLVEQLLADGRGARHHESLVNRREKPRGPVG